MDALQNNSSSLILCMRDFCSVSETSVSLEVLLIETDNPSMGGNFVGGGEGGGNDGGGGCDGGGDGGCSGGGDDGVEGEME